MLYNIPILTNVSVSTASKYVILDITPAVQGWLNVPASNLGLALLPSASAPCTWSTTSTSSISVVFDSKESTTTSHDAGLNVVVVPTPGQIPNLSQFYVDLSSAQTIGGTKTFSNTILGNVTSANTANSANTAGNASLFNGMAPSAFAQLGLSNTFSVGNRQTFTSNGTSAGLNIAPFGSDPGSKVSGDVWFTTADQHLHFWDGGNQKIDYRQHPRHTGHRFNY